MIRIASCFFYSFFNYTATWHQYDDAVFSEPGFLESLCSHIQPLRSIVRDPVEGRRMAMSAMLPELDSIFADHRGERLTAPAAIKEINKILNCMLNCVFENGGHRFPRELFGFDAKQVCAANKVLFLRNLGT